MKNKERTWLEGQVGTEIVNTLDDEAVEFYYRTMHAYAMSFQDADRYAWLNTLFGYDIGAERAAGIIRLYYEKGLDVMELQAESMAEVQEAATELGNHFNFSGWAKTTPETILYHWPEYLPANG